MSKIVRINNERYEMVKVQYHGCRGCVFDGQGATDGCGSCTAKTIFKRAAPFDEQTDDGGLLPPQGALE